MTEQKLRLIGSLYVPQYKTEAKIYVEDEHPSGQRHLITKYDGGGYGGDPEFAAAIPDDWTDAHIADLIFWPMKDESAPYPAWEVPARAFGSPELFRWWKGEKAS